MDRQVPSPGSSRELTRPATFPVFRSTGQGLGHALSAAERRIALLTKGLVGAGDGNRTHDIQLGKLTFYL